MQIGSKVVEVLKSTMETSDGGGERQTQLGGGGDQWCWLGFMGLGGGGQLGSKVVGRSGFFGHWWGLKVVNRWRIGQMDEEDDAAVEGVELKAEALWSTNYLYFDFWGFKGIMVDWLQNGSDLG